MSYQISIIFVHYLFETSNVSTRKSSVVSIPLCIFSPYCFSNFKGCPMHFHSFSKRIRPSSMTHFRSSQLYSWNNRTVDVFFEIWDRLTHMYIWGLECLRCWELLTLFYLYNLFHKCVLKTSEDALTYWPNWFWSCSLSFSLGHKSHFIIF